MSTVRPHSIWKRWTLCLFGHRPGEVWFRVQRGRRPQRIQLCTRCGVRVERGKLAL